MNFDQSRGPGLDNYYDISFVGNSPFFNKPKKNQHGNITRRTSSQTSISQESKSKRPGDYYVQRKNKSFQNLASFGNTPARDVRNNSRPISTESLASFRTNFSDDSSSVDSNNFDPHNSRLSSLTSRSVDSPSDSSSNTSNGISHPIDVLNGDITETSVSGDDYDCSFGETDRSDILTSCGESTRANSSASTLTANKQDSLQSTTSLTSAPRTTNKKQMLRASSTGSLLAFKPNVGPNQSQPSLRKLKVDYSDSKLFKDRQEQRKKMYDDLDKEEIILDDATDFVFNIPVMKSQTNLYLHNSSSSEFFKSSNRKISRSKSLTDMAPCPLPGKLAARRQSKIAFEDSILEESEDISFDDDSEIVKNISDFYVKRTGSLQSNFKENRMNETLYKIPSFIKSQSSLDSVQFMSAEKMSYVDQTRPINLPPKNVLDRVKHKKELLKVISDFEATSRTTINSRAKLVEKIIASNEDWSNLLELTDYQLSRKLYREKNTVRKLSWQSLCPLNLSFDYIFRVLSIDFEDKLQIITESFENATNRVSEIDISMKQSKESEFSITINNVLDRPYFSSVIEAFQSSDGAFVDLETMKENYKKLLFLKSFSKNELRKHDEIFFVPFFLFLFPSKSIFDIYKLTELLNYKILDSEFIRLMNESLNKWDNMSALTKSDNVFNFLANFDDISEFGGLNFGKLFEIFLHLNDRLPLSLSAPSTPVIAQSSSFFSSTSNSDSSSHDLTENIEKKEITITNSATFDMGLKLVQLIVIYANTKSTKTKNLKRIFESLLIVIFQYYHINWNNYTEVLKLNKSIRLNNTAETLVNLESFVKKWNKQFNSS